LYFIGINYKRFSADIDKKVGKKNPTINIVKIVCVNVGLNNCTKHPKAISIEV